MMRFKELYLTETPVAYDDETQSKIGKMHIPSKTKWGSTPKANATIDELDKWVEEKAKMKILKVEKLGEGSSRIAKANDGKTVFKYNFGHQPWGNQTKAEVDIYKKYESKYGDILAKILKYGDNWYVQEYAKYLSSDDFKHITGVNYLEWRALTSYIKDDYALLGSVLKMLKTKKIPGLVSSYNADIIKRISKSEDLIKIIEFAYKAKVDIGDLVIQNMGSIKNKLVITDFGFTNKMGGTK